MAAILSISYDRALLETRKLLLEARGHSVVSASSFREAVNHCKKSGFDLFILGHSMPTSEKRALIQTFRAACRAPIVSLLRFDEEHVEEVDYSAATRRTDPF